MSSLKIALLSYRSDPFSGGQGIYIKNISEALHNRGHEITIFSGNPLPEVNKAIKVVRIETPGFFETFDSNFQANFMRSDTTEAILSVPEEQFLSVMKVIFLNHKKVGPISEGGQGSS